MPTFAVVVRIETRANDETMLMRQTTIPCQDAAQAEAVRKILTGCAEQEKTIALRSAQETTHV